MPDETPSAHYLRGAAIGLRDAMRSVGLTPPPEHMLVPALLITLLTVLLATAYIVTLLVFPSRSSRDAVLIIGASPPSTTAPAPGKTTLFHVLRTGHAPPFDTLPTQVPSDGLFAIAASLGAGGGEAGGEAAPPAAARWIDYPGHSRLRPKMRDYVGVARGVVFVVDASAAAFSKTVREAADLLHFVLSDEGFEKSAAPVLVFCNKADTVNSVAPHDVRTRLEAELERARKAKSATLAAARNAMVEDVSGPGGRDGGPETVFLGFEDEVFSFDHIGNKVEFAQGSAKSLDVRAVAEFVATLK